MDLKVEEAIEIYREYSSFPAVKKAVVSNDATPGHIKVYSEWSQRDLERAENVRFSRTHIAQLDMVFSTSPHELNNEQWSVDSPSGKFRAVLRCVKGKKGEEDQYIEVWSDTHKLHNINVTSLDQHGKVYEDGTFGCLQWSHSETHLLYIAEKKEPKAKSFFDGKAAADIVAGKEDISRGDQHLYKEHWGEQLVGKSRPVVCVLDVEHGMVSTLDSNLPDHISAGQAVWCPDDQGIVCVGWWHDPYRVGLIYCPMRRSALFHINLKTFQYSVIGSDERSVRSPRFSPDCTKLVYLDCPAGGPHFQCSRLMMVDWATKGVIPVADMVQEAKAEDFPGIFCLHLAERCWSQDSRKIFLSSQWRTKQELAVIDVETGSVTRLTNDDTIGCWNLLDVHCDLLVATCSSPSMPPHLVLGQPPTTAEGQISWMKLDTPKKLSEINWRIMRLTVPSERVNKEYPELDYECMLLEPVGKTKPPLVHYCHGGPHSCFPADFSLSAACLIRCGYAVLMVNYRGSSGFGQDSIESLPGNVGTQDVQDVQGAVEHILGLDLFDRDRIVVTGGSHGGFLTLHLMGQYPDFYKAAVCRNPVVNIAANIGTSDIPDWNLVEATNCSYDFKTIGDAESYAKMWRVSPVQYADKMKTPLMIMIGSDDLRVPSSQGHELRRLLQARGRTVRTLCYANNNHPLNKVDAEADSFINMVQWFGKHLPAS